MEEIWKPVKDYENLYEISNLGRIKSKFKKWTVCNYKSKKDMIVYMNEKILSPSISTCGYKQIMENKN